MSHANIAIVYFSATHVTKTCAEVITAELQQRGSDTQLFNVTSFVSRQTTLPIEEFTGLVFGFPVFADFAPSVIDAWLPTLKGQGKPCAMFFTYGARTSGYAHFHTKQLLEQADFRVMCSAEFIGRHTFNLAGWRVLPDRPDERDFDVAREYAAVILERFRPDTSEIFTLQKPFGYNKVMEWMQTREKRTERSWVQPVRSVKDCQMCRQCEIECPNQAFNADTGVSDPIKCIECQHCVYICPDHVLQADARMKPLYQNFLADWCLTDELMQAKQSKIITTALQAAC